MAAAAEAIEFSEFTDEELIARVNTGDEAAFELLYARYFKRVYHFVGRRVRNRADAEETVQEVFINVFNSIHSFRGEGPFPAWVLGLTRRTVANRFKKRQHTLVPLDAEEGGDTIDLEIPTLQREASPLEHYECRERIARIESAATHELSGDQLNVVELHHLGHQSINEIATSLGKSEDAVKSNLYRARKVLLAR